MKRNVLNFTIFFVAISIAGCANVTSLLSTPTPDPTSQASATPQPLASATPTVTAQPEARLLRIWLPPRFDPNSDSDSAKLLAQRLTEFRAIHPGLIIDIRIKAEQGDASLINALTITHEAAPSALPDLIALPRTDFETAALNGLLHPMDGLSTMLDDPGWYPYARDLGHIQNIGYGLPFAGNALVQIHRPELIVNTWDDIFVSEESLLFPAGDPQGLIPLILYISADGKLLDDQGQPTLEAEPLIQTLTLIKTGYEANVIPSTVMTYKTDDQSFQAYRNGSGGMVITWATNQTENIHPIPGIKNPHTFADGWVWALAGSSVENQQLAVELAEYLLADDFENAWIDAGGFLPTRLSQAETHNLILEPAQLLPTEQVISVLGPIMNQALTQLFDGAEVDVIVQDVLEQIQK